MILDIDVMLSLEIGLFVMMFRSEQRAKLMCSVAGESWTGGFQRWIKPKMS